LSNRVVVTGLGAITPVGNDVETTWTALLEGRSGVAPITLFDASPFSIQIAGEVKNFRPAEHIDPKDLRRMDRNVQFAVVAARQAVKMAGLTVDESNADRVGVILGSAVGGIQTLLDQQKLLEQRGPKRVSPHFLQNMLPDTASGQVAIDCGAKGPNMAVVSACATGSHAIGEAFETLRRGDADVVLAGGTEAAVVPLVMAGFIVMRALAPGNGAPEKACRPFDITRQGFVMSEGCCLLVLESLAHAQKRGAPILAEVVGYGSSNDAVHLAAPADKGEGAARAMAAAVAKAGIRPEDIDYINPHGTGTPLNDKTETAAIKTVLGDHAYRAAISSTKSMTGHMMGATGALEAAVCVLAIRDGIIPPTINYEHPDPECDLDYVPNQARRLPVRVALSNSMGLGGHNSCVIIRRHELSSGRCQGEKVRPDQRLGDECSPEGAE